MFERELSQLEQQHLLRKPITVESYQGANITINKRRMLLMCSNDYLGLSQHPALKEAAASAMERYGFGSGASRLVSGTSVIHEELEHRLSQFKKSEATILFNSGYAANTGVIPALAQEGDMIFSDRLNHASIIDGCRLSRASTRVYAHKDMNHLETLLKSRSHARRNLVVTDGVFSMDGDIAPLPDLVLLAEKYNALLMVDDAHATGVLGKGGRGTVEHFGMEGRVPIQMGTLGKALGSHGAYVSGNRDLIDFLVNRARSYIYSTALPPAVCAASLAALQIIENDPARRKRLWLNRERFTAGLKSLQIDIGNSETPILPLMIGDNEQAIKVGVRLFESGIFATAIRPPTVPEGTSRIRATLTASFSDHDIAMALAAVSKVWDEVFSPRHGSNNKHT
ncbi:MAG TPA: 8-amino-7-oxononanoate synthase [Nitrospirota bacterium]|nr:8-amino-7-oxononanoate synthase [Nitrospirota bacterium]